VGSLCSRIRLLQRRDRVLAAAHRLGVDAQRDGRVCVSRKLGNEPDLDALQLQRRHEPTSSRVRCDICNAVLLEERPPEAAQELVVAKRPTSPDPQLWPWLTVPKRREDTMQLAIQPRTAQLPFQQQRAEHRSHRDRARSGRSLGQFTRCCQSNPKLSPLWGSIGP